MLTCAADNPLLLWHDNTYRVFSSVHHMDIVLENGRPVSLPDTGVYWIALTDPATARILLMPFPYKRVLIGECTFACTARLSRCSGVDTSNSKGTIKTFVYTWIFIVHIASSLSLSYIQYTRIYRCIPVEIPPMDEAHILTAPEPLQTSIG